MRFTQAATDFYKNVRKKAEATGAIPKPKPKPKPKTQRNVAEFELDGEKFVIEWDGVGDDADVARVVNGVKAQVAGGANVGAKFGASQIPTPKPQPKTEPKTWAQNAAESVGKKLVETGILGKPPTAPATGKRTERDLWEFASIKLAEDRQRYEQTNGPTPEADLVPYTFNVNGKPKTIKIPFWQVPELNAYKGGAIPSERERNQRRLAETVQRATDITESVKSAVTDNPITNTLGKLETGAMGIIAPGSENAYKNVVGDKGVVGHLAGMIAGALNVPVEVATEMAVITNPGVSHEQAVRATANILLQGGTLDAVFEKALKRGLSKRSAAIIEANSGITPPVPKTGTKAALPREVPPMRVAEPTQMPGFTGTTRRSVLEPKVPSVLDEVLAPSAAKPAVEPMPAPVGMAETSPVRGSVGETVPKTESGIFDSATWFKDREARVNASRKAGNTHLDAIPAFADNMRGIPVQNVHDANVKGRVLTVDNEGRVFVEWLDEHSQQVEMASPMQIGTGKKKRQAMVSWLGPRDLQDYIAGTAKPFDAPTVSPKPAPSTPSAPTSARYGTNYGTPQPGQGQRVGYPRSVLDEALGEPTPKPGANRAKEPWEMTADEYATATGAPVKPDTAGMGVLATQDALDNWRVAMQIYNDKTPSHQTLVQDAIRARKPVPQENLSPDLAELQAAIQKIDNGDLSDTWLHATVADNATSIMERGLEPRVGPFTGQMYGEHKVRNRVYLGTPRSVDNVESALLWQVGNKLGKWSNEVTLDDVREHGALAIVAKGDGKNASVRSGGKGIGVEPGDYITSQTVPVVKILTGDELIDAMRALKRGETRYTPKISESSTVATMTSLQNTPAKPPTSPVETPKPAAATVEPPAQTVTPTAAVAESATTPTTPTSARQATGLANVVQDAEADAGMIASSPRATGTKRGEAQAKGKAAVESGEIDPETLAAEIASGKRTFKDETEVGALMEGKRRLLQQADDIGKKIDEAHARGEDATDLIAQREAVRTRLNTLIENVQVGKGKWSDVGRSLQEGTTIDEGNFENVLAEFRRNKPDGKVSKREEDAIKDLVDQHNATKEQLAKVESELAQLKAAEGAQVIARKGTVGRRTVTQIRAERDLVAASISKSIREAIGGPIGFGGGGLENLFEVVPQLARDLRKLIELYIEEFKVGKLDSEFYVGAKQVIRDALADVPDEVLDDLKVDLKNLSDDEVNRIFGGIYDVKQSRTKSDVQARIAELKKQAELLAKIEGAKEGEVLKAGTPPPQASPTVRDLRAQLNELLKGLGADPSQQAVRTRLQNILDDLNKQSQGKYRNIKDNKTRVSPPDIQRIREQIASVRRDMRLEDTLADLEEQLATGNYKTPNKREIALTKQQIIMRDAVNEKRKIIRRKIAEASRGPFEKAMGVIDGAFSTLREGVATGDISFSGIQGSLALLTDTKAWANGTRASLKSYGSMGYDEIVKLIKSDADFDKIARTGVDLPAITSESEELFQNSVLQRVPVLGKGVKAAQRSYDGGATMTRYMMAKSHVALAESLNGGPLSDAAMKQIGGAVNSMSGRASSKLGKAVRTADFGRGIFAPSYWISLFEAGYRPLTTAIDVGAKTGDWGPAKVYARKTARMYAGGVAVLGTTKLVLESQTEWKVEIDPRSSLFGKAYKIKNGKVASVDLLPPQLSQAIKTLSMQAFGKKDLAGDVDTSAYGRTAWIGQLIEGKAAPGPKMFLSARDSMHVTNEKGTDAKPEDYPFGKNTDPRTGEGLKNLGLGSIPLTAQSAKEMIETDALSPLEKWLLAPLVVFGRGPSVYPLGKTAKKKLGL